jgi:hypothetical protein
VNTISDSRTSSGYLSALIAIHTFPDEIAERFGYDVRETKRIPPAGIVQRFTRRADGELEPLTANSTKPIAEVRTHAGIVRAKRYGFDMP